MVGHLPEDLKDFAWFGFWTGRRSRSIKKLRWPDIDIADYTIRFQAKNEKNRKAEAVAIPEGQIREIIDHRKAAQAYEDEEGNVRFSEYVFHRDGLPVGDSRKAWGTACRKAGVADRIFHDLRRTAARNLINAGVPQAVAMKITGHRTDSVFRRYAIVSPEQ